MLPGPRLVIDRSWDFEYGSRATGYSNCAAVPRLPLLHANLSSAPSIQSWHERPFGYPHKEYDKRPIALHICAESRAETLKTYTAVGQQYISFSQDTLWFPMMYFNTWTSSSALANPVPHIQSILIEGPLSLHEDTLMGNAGNVFHYASDMRLGDMEKDLPNLKEVIVKCPFEIPSDLVQGKWDDEAESDKPNTFRSYLCGSDDIDKLFGVKGSMMAAQKEEEEMFGEGPDEYYFKNLELKFLSGRQSFPKK